MGCGSSKEKPEAEVHEAEADAVVTVVPEKLVAIKPLRKLSIEERLDNAVKLGEEAKTAKKTNHAVEAEKAAAGAKAARARQALHIEKEAEEAILHKTEETRGNCTICGKPVFISQSREKDPASGKYYHTRPRDCHTLSTAKGQRQARASVEMVDEMLDAM